MTRGWLSGQSYEAISPAISREICKNLIPQIVPAPPHSHARNSLVFYGTPGLKAKYTVGTGPIRQLYFSNGRCFAVSGTELYEIFAGLTSTVRGTIANDNKPVCIDSNRFQLLIISADTTYIYDLTTNVLVNASVPLIWGVFADGYFAGVTPDSQILRISGQYDALTWDPLDFASSEGAPDNIVAIIADHRELWTFGEETTEVWSDSGQQAFPFDRIPGALIEQGCAAKNSVVKADNSIFWLGSDSRGQGIVWRVTGYTPQRVSNHALEYQLSTYSSLADAIGYAYQDQGHTFYVLTFPSANRTWVYDCSTTLWHERGAWTGGAWHRQQAQCHCYAFGMHLVGDKHDGIVYEQSTAYFTDNGTPKRWMRSAPIASNEGEYLFPSDLELDIEVGAGTPYVSTDTYPGNPQVMMRYSRDGGYTFGMEKWRGAGKIGEYLYRCRWPGALGRSRKPFVEFSGDSNARIAIVDAYVKLGSN
jgi:hypothetical protein